MRFVGLEHFQEVVQTPKFRQALQNTFLFAFGSQLLVLILANILAQVLRYEFRGKWLVRCLILLPWVAPISLGSIGWLWIFDSLYSVLNWTLQAFGFLAPTTRLMWLGKPNLALGCIIAVHVWRLLPLATVILMAGLSSIPQDIHDAAAMDGVGFWRHHFQITMPLVAPIMIVAVLFWVVLAVTDVIRVHVLEQAGAEHSEAEV